VERAIARDPEAVRTFVDAFAPVIQARVARVLLRTRPARDVRQDTLDLTQEVLARLFAADAQVLRNWDPQRGASLANFIGLVAEREALSAVRSGRRTPFREEPTEALTLERSPGATDEERRLASRQLLRQTLARLRDELSPLGYQVFRMLWCEQKTTEQVQRELGMSADAVYAWRSRIRRKARALSRDLEASA